MDEHRNFIEDIKKRFSDPTKYRIFSSGSNPDFLKIFNNERECHNCKVAILTVNDSKEQSLLIENLTREIKKIDPASGLILVFSPENSEEIKKAIRFNIDAYIPKNDNTVLRLHNAVKKLISEYNLVIYRKRRNFSIYIFLAFLLFSGMLVLIACIRFPVYF